MPEKAVPFVDLGMRRSWVFDQMVSRGVFVPVGLDRYYMSCPAAQAFLAAQRRRALVVTMILVVVFLIVLLASAHS